MKILLNWLKEFIDINLSTEDLAHRLTMAGFEVEAVEEYAPCFDKVVIGNILEIRPHPNADRLTLCKVNVGEEILDIVCGAKNIRAGDFVPVAREGAKLPGGLTIKASKIRGEFSQGMMCSSKELGLDGGHEGILLLQGEIPSLGSNFAHYLGLPDTALTLNVTPNRSDALSIRGIAREVSALTDTLLRVQDSVVREGAISIQDQETIQVQDALGCTRYMARVIQGVKVGPSPVWLRQRLERMGQRSINNIVDVTNWILLELGHPLHAFDKDKIKNSTVIVRRAKSDERMVAIDGQDLKLEPWMLVIADTERPIALAGIMGGKDTEVTEKTVNILLECACFSPADIRRASKSLNLISESSYRFERGVDPLGLPEALDRAALLIQRLSGGEIAKGVVDIYQKKIAPRKIDFRPERCRSVLGSAISDHEIQEVFRRLQFKIDISESGSWEIEIPTYRGDLAREIDLVEEVARLWGYERIEEMSPQSFVSSGMEPLPKIALLREKARSIFQGLGLDEAISYSFLAQEPLKKVQPMIQPICLLNPVRQDLSHLRTSLIPNLLSALALNENRGNPDVSIYELAKCFFPVREEVETLGIALMGRSEGLSWKGGGLEIDFFYLKGILETFFKRMGVVGVEFVSYQDPIFHPGRCAQLLLEKEILGILGEIHPKTLQEFDLKKRAYVAQINFEILARCAKPQGSFKELPRYPSITRDIAFVIGDSVSYQEIVKLIWEGAPPILEDVKIFDVYQGAQVPTGKKSLAISLCFRSREGTLKDEEVAALEQKIKERLIQKFQCLFR